MAELVAPQFDNQNRYMHMLAERQKDICNKLATDWYGPDSVKGVIFPGDDDQVSSVSIGLHPASIQQGKWTLPRTGEEVISPFVVGCVSYKFSTATHAHGTPFLYSISSRSENTNIYIRVGHSTKSFSDIVLSKYPFGNVPPY